MLDFVSETASVSQPGEFIDASSRWKGEFLTTMFKAYPQGGDKVVSLWTYSS
jgi:hypothetical protein